MSVFLVNRHTRAEEDNERADLIRSAVVGRHAPAAAASWCALPTWAWPRRAPLAAWLSGSRRSAAWRWRPPSVSWAWCSPRSRRVAAQVAGSGRASLGLGAGAVALAFTVRGVGDVAGAGPGVAHAVRVGHRGRAFAGERWWTLVGLAVFAAAVTLASFALSSRRDLGSGLLPQHAGRAEAAGWTTHPLGLAFRLQRGALVGVGRRPVRDRPRVRLRRRRRGRHAGRQPRAGRPTWPSSAARPSPTRTWPPRSGCWR